jgi:hypothetical protein
MIAAPKCYLIADGLALGISIVITHLLTLQYRWPGGAGGSDLRAGLVSHQHSEYSGHRPEDRHRVTDAHLTGARGFGKMRQKRFFFPHRHVPRLRPPPGFGVSAL